MGLVLNQIVPVSPFCSVAFVSSNVLFFASAPLSHPFVRTFVRFRSPSSFLSSSCDLLFSRFSFAPHVLCFLCFLCFTAARESITAIVAALNWEEKESEKKKTKTTLTDDSAMTETTAARTQRWQRQHSRRYRWQRCRSRENGMYYGVIMPNRKIWLIS